MFTTNLRHSAAELCCAEMKPLSQVSSSQGKHDEVELKKIRNNTQAITRKRGPAIQLTISWGIYHVTWCILKLSRYSELEESFPRQNIAQKPLLR